MAGVRAAAEVSDVSDSAVDRSAFGQELPDSRDGAAGNAGALQASIPSGRCCCRSRGSIASRIRWG